MSKSKSKSKATRSPARKPAAKRRRIPRDATGHPLLFDARTGKPTFKTRRTTAAEIAARRERLRLLNQHVAERRAAHQLRLASRPKQFTNGFTLPDDVRRFLMRLFDAGMYDVPTFDKPMDRVSHVFDVLRRLEAAYLQGCTQGYIEGRTAGLEPRRKASRRAHDAKRSKPREYAGDVMTMAERDRRIVAEYRDLCGMMTVKQARERLAEKYECDPRTIFNISQKAGFVAGRCKR